MKTKSMACYCHCVAKGARLIQKIGEATGRSNIEGTSAEMEDGVGELIGATVTGGIQ
jgi:hypothetical protein